MLIYRRLTYIFLLSALFFSIAACGGTDNQKQPKAEVTKQTPPVQIIKLFEKKCPGFVKYKDSLVFEKSYSMAYFPSSTSGLPKDTTVTWVVFTVPEKDTGIPAKFKASGYTLLAGIEKETGAIVLKGVTSKVFLDDVKADTSKDFVLK